MNCRRNADRRLTIPEFRYPARLAAAAHDLIEGRQDFDRILAGDGVGSLVHRDRSFGVVPERYAWYAKRSGFFLNSARIMVRVRGCIGKITGSRVLILRTASSSVRKVFGSSTLEGRCMVRTA